MASATRWNGQLLTLDWLVSSKLAIKIYDSEPAENCALNDDGSAYVEHSLEDEEWSMAEQLVIHYTLLAAGHLSLIIDG